MSATLARRDRAHTILIVDDIPANVGVVVTSLEENGYRVVIAQDGNEGLKRAQFVQPDLILLDVMMPGADGFETCRRLKALEGTRDIPVIFMTSLTDSADKVTGFEVGGVDYVTKPFQIAEVLARIRTHLTLREMHRQLEAQNAQLQREISDRRQVEEALEQNSAFLRQVIDINPHFIFAKDREGRFTLANRALAELFRTTVDDLIGKTDADIIPYPQEAEGFRNDDLEVMQTLQEKSIPEETVTDAAGQVHWMHTIKRPIVSGDGNAYQILGVSTDITARRQAELELHQYKDGLEIQVAARNAELTEANAHLRREISERKRAEEALGRTEAELRLIMDSVPAMICHVDADERYLYVNRAAARMLDCDAAEIVGRQVRDIVEEEAYPLLKSYMDRVLKGEAVSFERRRHKADGSVLDMQVNYVPDIDPAGRVIGHYAVNTDITERKRLEQDLQHKEAELRLIMDSVPAMISHLDANERFLYVNRAQAQMLDRDASEIVGSWTQEMIEEGAYPIIKPHIDRVLKGETVSFERRRRMPDGTELDLAATYVPDIDSAGRVVGFYSLYTDITERKRAEEALIEARRRLEIALEGSSAAIWDSDPRTGEIYLSAGWAVLLGDEPKETRTTIQELLKLVPPTEADRLIQVGMRAVKGEISYYSVEHRVRTKSGAWKWILSRGAVIERDAAGLAVRMSGTNTDITELRRAEQALRESEARFRSLVALSTDWYWEQDEQYRTTFMSPRYNAKTGLAMKSTLGQTRFETDNIWESEEQKRSHKTTVDARQPFRELRLSRYDEFGELRYLSISGEPVFDDDGRFTGYRGTGRDITEEKRAEAEIRRLNVELEARVVERTAQLVAANKELEAFSYSVSHDLRAPLRRIDGFSQLLLKNYTENLDAAGKDYLQRLRAGSQRMGQLIDDMLKLSRLTRSEMHHTRANLSKLAQGIVAELRQAQPERQVEVEIAPKLEASADPNLMRIALENLLSNAWKFTGKNPHARIEFGVLQKEDGGVYFVRDNGVGFDMSYADKLFTAFQRLHKASEFEGTGIGLATVRRVIDRHGGRVWAESAVNRGTTVYFTLPLEARLRL